MFRDLRSGFEVHILDKRKKLPEYKVGRIVDVSVPKLEPNKKNGIDKVVELSVDIDGVQIMYVVPDDKSVSSTQQQTISCTRDMIENELNALKREADNVVRNIEEYKAVSLRCDEILGTFGSGNNVAMQNELSELKKEFSELKELMRKSLSKTKE